MTIENQNNIDKSSVDSKANNLINSYNEKTENTVIYQGRYSNVLKGIVSKEDLNKDQLNQIYGILELLESSENITVTEGYITQLEQILKNKSAETVEVSAQTKQSILEDLPDLSGGNGVLSDIPVVGGALDGVPEAFNEAYEKYVTKENLNDIDKEYSKEEAMELLNSILIENKSRLDYGVTKIEDLMSLADQMDEVSLGNEIFSLWLPFDIEPEEWDIYFDNHNIPVNQREKFKDFFSSLTNKNLDAGNLFRKDIGEEIDTETKRILNLKNGEQISINHAELTDGNEIIFETKKDALLFLYYNKLLLREVATFWTDILIGISNTTSAIGTGVSFLADNPELVLWGITGYIGFAVSGTIFRNINGWYISKLPNGIFGKFRGKGVYLDEDTSLAGAKEKAELDKRNRKLEELKARFGSEDQRILDLEKWIYIADGTNTNDEGKGFIDSTFWRKVKNIENGSFFSNKWFDTFGKAFLTNSEERSGNLTTLMKNVRNEIFSDVEKLELKKGSFLYNAEQNILLSHDIKDADEEDLIKKIDEFKRGIKDNFGRFKGKNRVQVIKDIKKQLLNDINNKLTEKGTPMISGRLIFEDNKLINFKEKLGGNRINNEKKFIENIKTEFPNIDSTTKNKLKIFYNSSKSYDIGTAMDIIYRIINGDDVNKAINDSFNNKTQENLIGLYDENLSLWGSLKRMKDNNYDLGESPERLEQRQILELKKYNERLVATIESSDLSLQEKKGLLLKARNLESTLLGDINSNDTILFDSTYSNFTSNNNLSTLLSENETKEHFNSKKVNLKRVGNNISYSIGKTYNSGRNLISNGVDKVSTLREETEIKKYYNRVLASLELSDSNNKEKIFKNLRSVSRTGGNLDEYKSNISEKIGNNFTVLNDGEIITEITNRKAYIDTLKSMGLDVGIDGHSVKIKGVDPINPSKLSDNLGKTYKFLKYLSKAT